MTKTFDKLMVLAGFNSKEIKGVRNRQFLYAGNFAMLGIAGLFLAMMVIG